MKTDKPALRLAFVWHMHQPDYRNHDSQRMVLPWVRLHALKDYYDMPSRLENFDRVKMTFNIVPSLIEQMECYDSPDWSDHELDLFRVPASHLTESQKRSILSSFFMAPESNLISPYPRYASLNRDARLRSKSELMAQWTDQEWRDLQFWRQLSWIDPWIRERDVEVMKFFHMGGNFQEDQKRGLENLLRKWTRRAVEIYPKMQEEGRIEVSVSPFYHPILPLLIDPESAREAMPECLLPDPCGNHPEDARAQMELAIDFYEDRFGRKPKGVWPSEGAVSQETAELLNDLGVEWFASDEDILSRSLGRPVRGSSEHKSGVPKALYRPYGAMDGEGPTALFRDHQLSDLVGFEYQRWDPEKAAEDFVKRLVGIHEKWTEDEPPIVTVILDGENCWEYYSEDGGPFLETLYRRLESTDGIECVTVSEALEGISAEPLGRLSAGSWINGNFHIWIGEEADREAWSLLERTRRTLVQKAEAGGVSDETIREAWREIYIAEGSDWFWWFGDVHSTPQMSQFDEMFRSHLIRVYELLDLAVPPDLLTPVQLRQETALERAECYLLTPPIIDGVISHHYEWKGAAVFEPSGQSATMRAAGTNRIRDIRYGGDKRRFYLSASYDSPSRDDGGKKWEFRITSPAPMRVQVEKVSDQFKVRRLFEGPRSDGKETESRDWEEIDPFQFEIAEKSRFEMAMDWEVFASDGGGDFSFFIGVWMGNGEMEMAPALSCLTMSIPPKDKPNLIWFP